MTLREIRIEEPTEPLKPGSEKIVKATFDRPHDDVSAVAKTLQILGVAPENMEVKRTSQVTQLIAITSKSQTRQQ